MKPITPIKDKWQKYYEAKCQYFKNGACVNNDVCTCSKLAEIFAYQESVIPEEYIDFTIQDFDGLKKGNEEERLIPLNLVAKARDIIIKYCWKDIPEGTDYHADWIKKCILNKRKENGNSLIIYGDSWKCPDNGTKAFKRPVGKTMLAAIVMREAILQRSIDTRNTDSYAWVDYTHLINRLREYQKGDKSHEDDVSLYQEADWLVVDNIYLGRESEDTRNFRVNVLNWLFNERMEHNLPNILIFQDNIAKLNDLQYDFGISIANLANSRKTFKVALVEE